MAEPVRRRQGFLGRLAQLPQPPDESALAEVVRNLGFVFNTRKACGSVLPDFGLGDYEGEGTTRQAVETLRVELQAAVHRHEPRMREPEVRLLGRYRYNMVRFEITGWVDGQKCALGVDIDTTTLRIEVLVAGTEAR